MDKEGKMCSVEGKWRTLQKHGIFSAFLGKKLKDNERGLCSDHNLVRVPQGTICYELLSSYNCWHPAVGGCTPILDLLPNLGQ